jgi:hypothetical protein
MAVQGHLGTGDEADSELGDGQCGLVAVRSNENQRVMGRDIAENPQQELTASGGRIAHRQGIGKCQSGSLQQQFHGFGAGDVHFRPGGVEGSLGDPGCEMRLRRDSWVR